MKTVKEVSKISGVSVRTLHHYDNIGLLKPEEVTAAGYRLYGDDSLIKLQSILLLKEAGLSLESIKCILQNGKADQTALIKDQIRLLKLQRERLDKMIAHAENMLYKGENTMSFEAFDNTKLSAYAQEAKERWGDTDAYREYEKRGKAGADAAEGLMLIFEKFGAIKESDPAENEAGNLVRELQQYISDHFYTCSDEILYGLGQMYTADERFAQNIDSRGGQGTAEFVSTAIKKYLNR